MRRFSPAGRTIGSGVFTRAGRAEVSSRWCEADSRYFDSATSALAIAMQEAIARRPNQPSTRVLLPAYGCPNLIAAAVYAHAEPCFVDFDPKFPAPSLTAMRAEGGNVGVVVDFCGVPARAAMPSPADENESPALIHDLAQSYAPFMAGWRPSADRTVVSFGRAKPVSLTMGGALLGAAKSTISPAGDIESPRRIRLRSRIYNISLNPIVFGLLSRLPFLGIGTTEYHPIDTVRALDSKFGKLVASAVEVFRARQVEVLAGTLRALRFVEESGLRLPFEASSLPAALPIWRMPVLMESAGRAESFAASARRYGASRLYRRTLPEFLGISADEARLRWPRAWQLSRTLVTLPTHGRLSERDWNHLARLVKEQTSK